MSRPQAPSHAASAGRAGSGDESDMRSQLFAPQRKIVDPNSIGAIPFSRGPGPVAPTDLRPQPAASVVPKSSSPAVKSPAALQTPPVPANDASGPVFSPPVDGGDASSSASTEGLLDELQRRKTHNVRNPTASSICNSDLLYMRYSKKLCSKKRKRLQRLN